MTQALSYTLDEHQNLFGTYTGFPSNDTANNKKLLAALTGKENETQPSIAHWLSSSKRERPLPSDRHQNGKEELSKKYREKMALVTTLFWLKKNCTAANLEKEEKNKISHRKALALLLELLQKELIL